MDQTNLRASVRMEMMPTFHIGLTLHALPPQLKGKDYWSNLHYILKIIILLNKFLWHAVPLGLVTKVGKWQQTRAEGEDSIHFFCLYVQRDKEFKV